MDKRNDSNVSQLKAPADSDSRVITDEVCAEIMAAFDGVVGFREPMTPQNCKQLLKGLAIDFVNLQRQNIALRNALKEAL